MGFLKSAVNQMGRDFGRALSNQYLKDAHAAPIRVVNGSSTQRTSRKGVKSDFEKAISFQTSFKPNTLVSKLGAAYIELKNEANNFIEDGYLDVGEIKHLVNIFNDFNNKARDISEILELDEVSNNKEMEQILELANKTNEYFLKTLQTGIDGFDNEIKNLENQLQEEKKGIGGFLGGGKIKKQNEQIQARVDYEKKVKESLMKVLDQMSK